jgi:uncharacterized protein YegP (UPF0339 family)
MNKPHFELLERKDGKIGFRLRAANGEILFASQGYASRRNAEDGIEAVKKAVTAIVYRNTPTQVLDADDK